MIGLEWKKSYATDTRLMGVVVIKTYLEDRYGDPYVMFSHLDYESYGYDGLTITEIEDEEWLSDQIYGGLGGQLVKISFEEANHLIQSALAIGHENIAEDDLPYLGFFDMARPLSPKGINKLYQKVCTQIRSPYEAVNYYLMRLIGDDLEMARWLSVETPPVRFEKNCTLMRCKIDEDEGGWIASALVLSGNAYSLHRFSCQTEGTELIGCTCMDQMDISGIEAALQLKSPEHVALAQVSGSGNPFEDLDDGLRHKMVGEYESGALFTVFHNHNDHVDQPIYTLNGDVDFYCYMTVGNQLLVVCRDSQRLFGAVDLVKRVLSGYNVEILGELSFEHQVLYDFIQSGYDDFIDYIEEEFQPW